MRSRGWWGALAFAALFGLTPVVVWAQPDQAGSPTRPAGPPDQSRAWIVAGGAWTGVRGDCGNCDHTAPYLRSGSPLFIAGYRVNDRMDVGAEITWIPSTTGGGDRLHTTSVVAVAQFRPWASSGFFVNGGMGMAFVRNFLYESDRPSVTSKALAVGITAGWAFRRSARLGYEVFGSQHVAALGDLATSSGPVENLVANYWFLGAAIVIR